MKPGISPTKDYYLNDDIVENVHFLGHARLIGRITHVAGPIVSPIHNLKPDGQAASIDIDAGAH
jgi:hypothetical protein